MKFYSGKGDHGTTTLFGCPKRFSKSGPRYEALGAVDELNSYLGICKSLSKEKLLKSALRNSQECLFIIQAELGSGDRKKIKILNKEKLTELEKTVNYFGNKIGVITKFTLSGGTPLSAHLDYTRALARKTERKCVATKNILSKDALAYLNRLSSLFFVLARYTNKKAGILEDHPAY